MKKILASLQHEHDAAESVWEQERQRIAQGLHDELGKQMLALHMDLAKLCENILQFQSDLQGSASLAMRRLSIVMKSLLTVVRGLRPDALDRGFCSAVEWQCEQFSARSGVPCHLCWSRGDINIPKNQSLVLFRAFQEALNNVQQHATASRAYVIVNSDANNIALTVVDDGVGMALDNQAASNFYQLAGTREQILNLGGRLSLCSAHNNGTAVNIGLPVVRLGLPSTLGSIVGANNKMANRRASASTSSLEMNCVRISIGSVTLGLSSRPTSGSILAE